MAQRYDTYKDSGVQWLGEIPSHWGCVALKRICEMKSGNNITALDILDEGIYPVYGANGLRGYYNQYNKDGKYILIGRQGALAGNVHLVDGKFWATDHAIVTTITSDKFFTDYLALSLETMHLNQYAFDTAAQPGLAISKIISLSSPIPPLPEQHSIVTYLDDKCAKIDEWIEKKEKEVVLLGEMKQRVIADAVTRGLNPNVKMKETGIFWWTQCPSHWNVFRLGNVIKKQDRPRPDNAELLVCTNKGKVVLRGDSKMGLVADSDEIYQGVKKGDLLIHGMDTWHGAIAVSEYDGMCTPVVHVCTSENDCQYVAYYMQVMAYSKIFKLISNGVRQNTSDFRSWNKVNKIPIPLPPISEQQEIVAYINDKTSKIDTLVEKVTKEIEHLKEYKQRLISDVVTGQVKVC